MIVMCKGFLHNNATCYSEPTPGFDYCSTCFEFRRKKFNLGKCVKTPTCPMKRHDKYSFCVGCHLNDMTKFSLPPTSRLTKLTDKLTEYHKIWNGHNCSYRGGVACSECDDIHRGELRYLLLINDEKKRIISTHHHQ